MRVSEIKEPPDVLVKIEFANTGDEDFKEEIKNWIRDNYPEMSFQEFFDRLEEFRMGKCTINMRTEE